MKNTYTANKSNEKQTRMQFIYEDCGTGQRHEQGENTTTDYCFIIHKHLHSSTSRDMAPQLPHK